MKNVTVSNLSLVLAFALVLVSIAISAKENLGLTKDILISVIRAIVQLVIIGFVLKFIFHLIGTLALFSIMMFLNNWLINWQTLFIFILAYAMIWLVIRLTQGCDIRRINQEA